jgi:HSP20 family protein
MTLVRRKPLSDTPVFQDDVSRLFDEIWRRGRNSDLGSWAPAIDLTESETEFKMMVELPGMTKDDVKITLNDNMVTLRGEKKASDESKKENWLQVERTYGAFERSFQLSSLVDKTKVNAKFENGVLTVTLPKSEDSRPREISID